MLVELDAFKAEGRCLGVRSGGVFARAEKEVKAQN
jgi:hypothetical protein